MTNKPCRDFLKIDNTKLMIDLLNKMNLKREGIGPGRGQYYCSPSYETFDHSLRQEINNKIWKWILNQLKNESGCYQKNEKSEL